MITYDTHYDVIVIGAGHAGCEASLATARLGFRTLLLTANLDTIALMSCNPAIGGLAKGHLVREIDALGGEMAKAIDYAGIQFRVLNKRKGPAVRSSRAQADRTLYRLYMKKTLETQPRLDLKQAVVERLLVKEGSVCGVDTQQGIRFLGRSVIVTTGTFLRGLLHIGLNSFPGGRAGEGAVMGLSESLESLGIVLGRLKTGTTPRLDAKTIDFQGLDIQHGDEPPRPFSFTTARICQPQVPCYITYTNEATHAVIRSGLDRSPLYTGVIKGIGPRYCPSIEDKVVRFPDKGRHQIFLEPEGYETKEVYPNGLATSLPVDIQLAFLRTIPGLERVEIMRPGYAVEYDFAYPTQLRPSLEVKKIENLFFAGQINGTSGYEEAAAQGLIAGINAAAKLRGEPPLVLDRSEAYIGVLIDDLVTQGTTEPYRMFTSRAEYRLLLREDNADLRLCHKGYDRGLVRREQYEHCERKKRTIATILDVLEKTTLTPDAATTARLKDKGIDPIKGPTSLAQLLRRPGVHYFNILELGIPSLDQAWNDHVIWEEVEIQVKYASYIEREREQVERFQKMEHIPIPDAIDFRSLHGLSNEVKEKLSRVRPASLGQASRISGVTPAAITALLIHLKKMGAV